ncbi:hypothetical protein LWI28_015460 [Acer negundo]|uniref:Uncharacterized protein n=1 Tax=Acer negundo TaxID=4023 RepID=A0AAD5J538_ACENE|nr:hypothetical protein LWI28_015460 [Acer negundo]
MSRPLRKVLKRLRDMLDQGKAIVGRASGKASEGVAPNGPFVAIPSWCTSLESPVEAHVEEVQQAYVQNHLSKSSMGVIVNRPNQVYPSRCTKGRWVNGLNPGIQSTDTHFDSSLIAHLNELELAFGKANSAIQKDPITEDEDSKLSLSFKGERGIVNRDTEVESPGLIKNYQKKYKKSNYSSKIHGMKTRNSKKNGGEESRLAKSFNSHLVKEEVAKVIETVIALGVDFNSKEEEIVEILVQHEKEDAEMREPKHG